MTSTASSDPHFERTMSKWENFSLGFTYLSPVVGVYTMFGASLAIAGPPFWWAYLIVGAGQLLVSLVFGEIVSQYPIAGGLYPWARRLGGRRLSWMVGWIYAWALYFSIAGTATGAAPFVAAMLAIDASPLQLVGIALLFIAAGTALNLMGTKILARVALFGFACEITGAVVVGAWLLLFDRHNGFSVLLVAPRVAGGGSYLPAFFTGSIAALFAYYGFEACGDVAEEVPKPETVIPQSMRLAVIIGGAAATFICLALILSVPDIAAVLAGRDTDPITTVMVGAFGPYLSRAILLVLLVSFFSCVLSLQAVASRLLFAFGRDRMFVGGEALSRLSPHTHIPVAALAAGGIIPAILALSGLWMTNAIGTIVSAASAGIYVAFLMVVGAAVFARLRGWQPSGPFHLGRTGGLVSITALLFCLGSVAVALWPRAPGMPWWSNYGMSLTIGGLVLIGAAYMLAARPHERSDAASGDARGRR